MPTGLYFLLPVMRINLQVLGGSGGMICSLVDPCLFGVRMKHVYDTHTVRSVLWYHDECSSSVYGVCGTVSVPLSHQFSGHRGKHDIDM